MSYNIHEQFFIPLVDLTVDVNRIRNEVFTYINPTGKDYGLTCTLEDVANESFDFKKHSGIRPTSDNKYLLRDGYIETDVIHWPKILQGTYIEELGKTFAKYLELSPPRCRLSYFNNKPHDFDIDFHYDNHTPYRVHVVLESSPGCIWKYRWSPDHPSHSLHHPVMEQPVLINTGSMQHAVHVPKNHRRLHLWYQFHSKPKEELVDSLIEKYKMSIQNH